MIFWTPFQKNISQSRKKSVFKTVLCELDSIDKEITQDSKILAIELKLMQKNEVTSNKNRLEQLEQCNKRNK